MHAHQDQEFSPPIEKGSPMAAPLERPTSKLSVLSLVFGILGITGLPLIGSLIAIVTGHAALGEIRESQGQVAGRQMAKGGLWLGYGLISLVLVAVTLFISVFVCFGDGPRSWQALNHGDFSGSTRILRQEKGVKLVNEMDRGDYQLIEDSKVEVSPKEIIACYNAGMPSDNAEFALVTTGKLIYLKEGRTTDFEYKDMTSLKNDEAFRKAYQMQGANLLGPGYNVYHIEVQSKAGQRMRIMISPMADGPIFFDALLTAANANGANLSPN